MIPIFRIPKVQLATTLFLIFLTALANHPSLETVRIVILSLLFTIGTDLFFTYLRKRALFIPYAALITGLILSLTLNPYMQWHKILLVASISMGAKNFLRISNHHVFNPAAIGLVIGNMLLHDTVSWWGVSFQVLKLTPLNIVSFLILLLPLLVSGIRMKRFGSIGSFLITYSVLLLLQHNISPLATITDPTVLFFALTMLPEPMTSPVAIEKQILFGGFVAIAAITYVYLPFSRSGFAANLLPDGLLPFLLLGNLVFFKFR